ncbi:hypothetical protein K469DRAFT_746328 [Zopfia rhizophila CBS 207.26]|uniref:Uncharacterized protein n=1 Tax=Zopfia rhizophila CBS 207.26 TaxID=1314779 RepID=A0A6A6ELP9_9PEZI|nr:hypothetical protein K469DRAFT_746328 [Zopfia rhizophila CBS 207.26]
MPDRKAEEKAIKRIGGLLSWEAEGTFWLISPQLVVLENIRHAGSNDLEFVYWMKPDILIRVQLNPWIAVTKYDPRVEIVSAFRLVFVVEQQDASHRNHLSESPPVSLRSQSSPADLSQSHDWKPINVFSFTGDPISFLGKLAYQLISLTAAVLLQLKKTKLLGKLQVGEESENEDREYREL